MSRFPNGRNQISRLPGSGGNSALIEEIIEETRYTALCLQIFHQRPQRDLHSLTARKFSLLKQGMQLFSLSPANSTSGNLAVFSTMEKCLTFL